MLNKNRNKQAGNANTRTMIRLFWIKYQVNSLLNNRVDLNQVSSLFSTTRYELGCTSGHLQVPSNLLLDSHKEYRYLWGHDGGLVVTELALYTDELSSNPVELTLFEKKNAKVMCLIKKFTLAIQNKVDYQDCCKKRNLKVNNFN